MQRAISDKIELGETLNPLKDYSGVPSINDEGTLENLIGKVDKVIGFVKTGKEDGDLSRYYPNILPITRQLQIAGEVPWTVNNFFGHWFTDIDIRHYPGDTMILPTNNSVDIYEYSNSQMKYLPEKSVKKLLKTMLYSNKPVYLAENVDRRPNNDNDDNKRSDPNLTYRIAQLRNYIFEKNVYRIPLTLLCNLGKVNFAMKTDSRIIIALERNLNKLFESNKKVAAIPDNPDALIQIYDRPYVSYQEISLTQGADIYFTGILRSETALKQGVLPSPYQQVFEVNTGMQDFLALLKERKGNLIGLKFQLFLINHINRLLFMIVMI